MFSGLAALSGHGGSAGHGGSTPVVALSAQAGASEVYAAPASPDRPASPVGQGGSDGQIGIGLAGGATNICRSADEARDALPVHRWWTSFTLANGGGTSTMGVPDMKMIFSAITGMFFGVSALIWEAIALLMGFSFSFDLLCTGSAATEVNNTAGLVAQYAGWFMIPVWLFVFARAIRRWYANGGGPTAVLRLVLTFSAASGMIFYLADQSAKHPNDPLAPHTAPWMAEEVQKWFAGASSSLLRLGDLGAGAKDGDVGKPFYDTDPKYAGYATCAGLDDALYKQYEIDNKRAGSEVVPMEEISRIWETTYLRAWISAQFGNFGNRQFPAAAHAACRLLEANSAVPASKKWAAYDDSAGLPRGSTDKTYRGFWISSGGNQNDAVVAWSACEQKSPGSAEADVTPEWASVPPYSNLNPVNPTSAGTTIGKDINGSNTLQSGCKLLMSSTTKFTPSATDPTDDSGPLRVFFAAKSSDFLNQIASCKDRGCAAAYVFVANWLGDDPANRLTQGMMSLVVAIVFLIIMLPMAVGLTLISCALALLVMLLGLSILLVAMGNEGGKKLLKLTGAAAAGKFLYTLALTFMMMFIVVTDTAINGAFGTDSAGFGEQLLQAAAPLIGLVLFKKLAKVVGLGNIVSMKGSLGFAGASALNALGSAVQGAQRIQQGAAALFGGGEGAREHGRFDESSMDKRMLESKTKTDDAAAAKSDDAAATSDDKSTKSGGLIGMLAAKTTGGVPLGVEKDKGGDGPAAAANDGAAPDTTPSATPIVAQEAAGFKGVVKGIADQAGSLAAGTNVSLDGDGPLALSADGAGKLGAVGVPLSTAAATAQASAAEWRFKMNNVSDGGQRIAKQAKHMGEALDDVVRAQWGEDFTGFANDTELNAGRAEMADVLGVGADQLMVHPRGIVLPVPGSGALPHHPVHSLDPATLQKGYNEAVDDYILRLAGALENRGFIDHSEGHEGNFIDVRAFQDYLRDKGQQDLAKDLVISSPGKERPVVRSALDWGKLQPAPRPQKAPPLNPVLERAHQTIDDGGAARKINDDFKKQCIEFQGVIERMNDLYAQRDDHKIEQRAFRAQQAELEKERRRMADEIGPLIEDLRDRMDRSAAARRVCQLRMESHGSSGADSAKLAAAAREMAERLDREEEGWHRVIDRGAGRLSKAPRGDVDIQRALRELDFLRDAFDRRIQREEDLNLSVRNRWARFEDQEEKRRKRPDPRAASRQSSPVKMGQHLDAMFRGVPA